MANKKEHENKKEYVAPAMELIEIGSEVVLLGDSTPKSLYMSIDDD